MSAVILIMLMSLGTIITGQMGKVALAERAREEIMGVVEGAEQVGVRETTSLTEQTAAGGGTALNSWDATRERKREWKMRTQRDVCLYLEAYNQLSRHKE